MADDAPDKKQEARKSILEDFRKALSEQETEPKKPNELDSTCGVGDDEFLLRFREAVERENERSKAQGLPVTGYDRERNASYIEYPDGRRVYGDKT